MGKVYTYKCTNLVNAVAQSPFDLFVAG